MLNKRTLLTVLLGTTFLVGGFLFSEEVYSNDTVCVDIEEVSQPCNHTESKKDKQSDLDCECEGGWIPVDRIRFPTFLADPRKITYSAGWRFRDQALADDVINVSYGDSFSIYQWCNVWPWGGILELDFEAAVWAVFAPLQESSPLLNADYYFGFPLVFKFDKWLFRLRGYHISSHVGDEFLIKQYEEHTGFIRSNPSAEYLDLYVSRHITDEIRSYGGVCWVVGEDESFTFSRFSAAAGIELRLKGLGFINRRAKIVGIPFYAMHFRYASDFKNHVDATYVLGYEIGKPCEVYHQKPCGLHRKLRVYLEYHDGYSVEGQFSRFPTNYLSLCASYGF